MKTLLIALALAAPAQAAAAPHVVRVDRPEKGAGAAVTTVRVIHGSLARRMRATVLTDSRCQPDRTGTSHCLNALRLANGTRIVVVHDHRMAAMPCLSPGEHVVLTPR